MRDGAWFGPTVTEMAVAWLLVTINGKLAAVLGVLVAPFTIKEIPLVEGMLTEAVHVIEPAHVRRIVSPSCVEDAAMAELMVAAEQSEGPSVITAARSGDAKSRK